MSLYIEMTLKTLEIEEIQQFYDLLPINILQVRQAGLKILTGSIWPSGCSFPAPALD